MQMLTTLSGLVMVVYECVLCRGLVSLKPQGLGCLLGCWFGLCVVVYKLIPRTNIFLCARVHKHRLPMFAPRSLTHTICR